MHSAFTGKPALPLLATEMILLAGTVLADTLPLRLLLATGVVAGAAALWSLSGGDRPQRDRAGTPAAEPEPPRPAPEDGGKPDRDLYEEKVATVSRFASITSHELKNPLASLKNIAFYLTRTIKTDDPRLKRMIEMLSSEIDRTNALIVQLLDLTRVKKVNKAAVDVAGTVAEYLDGLKQEDGLVIERDLESVQANADPDRIRQVVANLLSNARDAMPEGGTVTVGVRRDGDFAELSVTDTGCGMDPETRRRALEPVFTTKTKSLGLGLTVVNEVARLHDGSVAIRSEKGGGTAVTVRFRTA